jgi:hypothetical protein
VSKGVCSSGECGRPLIVRTFWKRDGHLDAATVCFRCDGLRIWGSYKQPKSA